MVTNAPVDPTHLPRVLILDEQPVVRTGLRVMLDSVGECTVVAEADTADAAEAASRKHCPDVILMEVRLSAGDGLAVLSRLAGPDRTPPRVVVLTNVEVADCVVDSLRAGASGYVLKRRSAQHVSRAVCAALNGEMPIDPAVMPALADDYLVSAPVVQPYMDKLACMLSEREGQVVQLLGQGMDTNEIASTLHVSRSTVKSHISNTLTKWDVRDRLQLVARAHEIGFLRP